MSSSLTTEEVGLALAWRLIEEETGEMFVNFCNNSSSSSNNNNYLLSEKATIRANIGDCFAPDLDKFRKILDPTFQLFFKQNFGDLS